MQQKTPKLTYKGIIYSYLIDEQGQVHNYVLGGDIRTILKEQDKFFKNVPQEELDMINALIESEIDWDDIPWDEIPEEDLLHKNWSEQFN